MGRKVAAQTDQDADAAVKTSLSLPAGIYQRFVEVARRRGMKIGAAVAQAMEEWTHKFDEQDEREAETVFRSGTGLFRPLGPTDTQPMPAIGESGIGAGEALWVQELLTIIRAGDADLQTGIQLTLNCYEQSCRIREAARAK